MCEIGCGPPVVWGDLTAGQCPTENRAGSCTYGTASNNGFTYVYYSPQYTAATAQSLCTAGGVWTAG